jgi:hypothetical protein
MATMKSLEEDRERVEREHRPEPSDCVVFTRIQTRGTVANVAASTTASPTCRTSAHSPLAEDRRDEESRRRSKGRSQAGTPHHSTSSARLGDLIA